MYASVTHCTATLNPKHDIEKTLCPSYKSTWPIQYQQDQYLKDASEDQALEPLSVNHDKHSISPGIGTSYILEAHHTLE